MNMSNFSTIIPSNTFLFNEFNVNTVLSGMHSEKYTNTGKFT